MQRRSFLTAASAFAALGGTARGASSPIVDTPRFRTRAVRWQATYDRALAVLAGNVQVMPRYDRPVLIEGSAYQGIWQECGPHEALVYAPFRPDVARYSHLAFFALQRPDGQLPANNKRTEAGFGQIQMVVPIAATAWELARDTGDGELLETAYRACAAWDGWLGRYRDTRGTGLVEGFCTYDTGHDNSPRWAGMPVQCPDKDARRHAPVAGLPRLCPDLSATVYGGRRALAAMARALGRNGEADRWIERADTLRAKILSTLYVAEEAAFYDLDADDRFVRVRSDILSRMCGEHVPDQALFDTLWRRQIHDPRAFWAAWPLPSIALDDPAFVRPIPSNSWGGASQALTALRAGRWFDHYGRSAELATLMDRWCEALQRDPGFRQQIDPRTGAFTQADPPGYSPAALLMVDFTWRLIGIETPDRDTLHWNVRPGHPAADHAVLDRRTPGGVTASMAYADKGATLSLGGRTVARIAGGAARLVTDGAGKPVALIGLGETPQAVTVRLGDGRTMTRTLAANQRVAV
jgi:hypothetical protein